MTFPPIETRIRDKVYKSRADAARGEGVTTATIIRHAKDGTLDLVGIGIRKSKEKTEPFTVRGYTYTTYEECGKAHGVSGTTVKSYVKAGRNDELPARHKPGRSEYLDRLNKERLERKERYKRNKRETYRAKYGVSNGTIQLKYEYVRMSMIRSGKLRYSKVCHGLQLKGICVTER